MRVDFEGKDAVLSTVNVEGPVAPVAADPPFVILAPAAVARLDRVSLAQAASPSPSWATRVVPRADVGLFDILLENARLLLAVVICVREPSQNSAAGHASTASVNAKGRGFKHSLRQKCRPRDP